MLCIRWRDERDRDARETLIARFLPLARRLAGRYRTSQEPFDDLVQVATVGLIGAVDRFDPDRGAAFASFAIPTILGELKRHFRHVGWSVHVPRRAQELSLLVEQASRGLTHTLGRSPTIEELAEYLEVEVADVLTGLEASMAQYSASLDAPRGGGESGSEPEPLHEAIGRDDDRLGLVDASASLAAAVRQLPPREREALSLRFNDDLTQTEIGERLGCSQMQVSRLLRRAASRMRELADLQ
jgi:RNA polymerase sigma-B factor